MQDLRTVSGQDNGKSHKALRITQKSLLIPSSSTNAITKRPATRSKSSGYFETLGNGVFSQVHSVQSSIGATQALKRSRRSLDGADSESTRQRAFAKGKPRRYYLPFPTFAVGFDYALRRLSFLK